MPRIRTVKPEFFRDEDLQDLEMRHPEAKPMLVFEGLWGHCDKQGVFEWKPRVLKLDILPFLPFDMETTLGILEAAGLVEKFEHEGRVYGLIDSFPGHQRIGGKEHSDPAKYPGKPKKQRGSSGEAPEQQSGAQEGKGREGGKEGKGKGNAREETNGNSSAVESSPQPEVGKDFSGQSAPPSEPSRPRNGSQERRNGDFEVILDDLSKLLASGAYKPGDYRGLAQALHVSALQAEVAVRQLRDRGRLPAVAGAAA